MSLSFLFTVIRCMYCSVHVVQFSPLTDWFVGGTWGVINRDPLPVFSAGDHCEQFLHGQGCPRFDVVHPTFHLPTMVSPSKVPWRMVLERLLWHVTCPNHASFRLLTVARRGLCGPTRKLILLRAQLLILCSKPKMQRSFFMHLVSKAWMLFSESAIRVRVSQP